MQLIIAILMMILGQQSYAYQSGNAPFCAMDDTGNKQCFYYSMSACQSAIQYSSGKYCVTN